MDDELKLRIGIDVGGTFTDLVAFDENSGNVQLVKTGSTPPTFVDGVITALKKLGCKPNKVSMFINGTTILTNAILERKGARVGLLTTNGFRDLLQLRRGNRGRPNYWWKAPPPLVPRRDILEVSERIDYNGDIVVPLNEKEVMEAGEIFRKRGIQSVAVCFINAYKNPHHEAFAKKILKETSRFDVYASFEAYPEIREYERLSTTVIHGYVGPLMQRYADTLTRELAEFGYTGPVMLMTRSGGVATPDMAIHRPGDLCLSGPAAGAIAGATIAMQVGEQNAISLDVGGTSSDISIMVNGEVLKRNMWEVEFGIPLMGRSMDVNSIGSGGGSIAWIDRAGSLKVGPQSAGAVPGPACYNRGGRDATLTDANLILGRISGDSWRHYYDWPLRKDLSEEAVREKVAKPLGLTMVQAAHAITAVTEAQLSGAVRRSTVERGYDPRDFTLVAFGGAGPLHAVNLAKEVGIPKIIVPLFPGAMSAAGLLLVDSSVTVMETVLCVVNRLDLNSLEEKFVHLEKTAARTLSTQGYLSQKIVIDRMLDVRYQGQGDYITLPIPAAKINDELIAKVLDRFKEKHTIQFGYTIPEDMLQTEFVNARIEAHAVLPKLRFPESSSATAGQPNSQGFRMVYFHETQSFMNTQIFLRKDLVPYHVIAGPAIVEQMDTTIVIPPKTSATIEKFQNIMIETMKVT